MSMARSTGFAIFPLLLWSAAPLVAQDYDPDLPASLVQALHSAFGEHHARAVHAKGIILQGTFQPDAAAQMLSTAALFTADTPVIVRFSNFTGIPDIPDTMKEASPRGFAIRFGTLDAPLMDIVGHDFNGFPTRTAAEFGDLLRALAASGAGVAKPTPLDQFLAAHPLAATFLTTQNPPPESFATTGYFGVNAVTFINAGGERMAVRYQFVPQAGKHYLDDTALAKLGPAYLGEEIVARLAKGPVVFDWFAQVAESSDILDDPSIAWPDTRRVEKLGTITITGVADQAIDSSLMFLPGQMPDGIEIADPMLEIRDAAYPISFGERQ